VPPAEPPLEGVRGVVPVDERHPSETDGEGRQGKRRVGVIEREGPALTDEP
jgi:hypothetical protein